MSSSESFGLKSNPAPIGGDLRLWPPPLSLRRIYTYASVVRRCQTHISSPNGDRVLHPRGATCGSGHLLSPCGVFIHTPQSFVVAKPTSHPPMGTGYCTPEGRPAALATSSLPAAYLYIRLSRSPLPNPIRNEPIIFYLIVQKTLTV